MNPARLGRMLLVPALATAAVVAAEDDRTPDPFSERRGISDRFNISIGGFLAAFDTEARLDADPIGLGTQINLEDDLGLKSEARDFRVEGFYRFARKHRLDFDYVLLDRSSTVVVEEQIDWGDITLDVGATATSKFDTQIVRLSYKYSFRTRPRYDAGISFGLSTFIFNTGISGEGSVTEPDPNAEVDVSERTTLVAPVPVLGLHYDLSIRPKVLFRVSGEFFALDTGDWNARLAEWRVAVDYFPFKRFGFGLAVDWIDVNYVDEGLKRLEVNYRISGIYASVSYGF